MKYSTEKHDSCRSLPNPDDWTSIREWRKTVRTSLIEARIRIGSPQRKKYSETLQNRLSEIILRLPTGTIGFYWPIQGEFDLRSLVAKHIDHGWRAALPVALNAGEPLEFRLWRPGMKLIPGVWKIPVPAERNIVSPSVLLVPLVGFDPDNYRLGYGGGYYDRTLACFGSRPVTIGVGLKSFRLATIYPQWHDIPMDRIVTETGEYSAT